MAKGKPAEGCTEKWLLQREEWRRRQRTLEEAARPADPTVKVIRELQSGPPKSSEGFANVRFPHLRSGVYVQGESGRFELYTGPRNRIYRKEP